MVAIHWFVFPVHRFIWPLSLQCLYCKHAVRKIYPSKRNNIPMQELLRSLLECYSSLGQAYDPSLNQSICGDICVALWTLESLEIWYIWSPNISLFIIYRHRHFFFQHYWSNFPFHFVHIKNKILLIIPFFWVGWNHTTYILHPYYFLFRWTR